MPTEMISLDPLRKVEILTPENIRAHRPLLVLAHGSGKDMNSPFLSIISEGVQNRDIQVARFNFPYKVARRQVPDRSEILEDSWKLVIRWATEHLQFSSLFIGGKSMGGRIATMVAGDFPQIAGLVFLGYPLHPPGRFDQVRDEYLHPLPLPMLFVQGTRDAFARMDLLQITLGGLRDRATLHWIEGGDHSYQVLIRPAQSYLETLQHVAGLVSDWILEIDGRRQVREQKE